MATIYPDSCPSQATESIKALFQYFQYNLPNDFQVWYEPSVELRLPDFIILSPSFGLITLQVKDWTIEQIRQSDPSNFEIYQENKKDIEICKSPLRQSQSYAHIIMSKLREYPILRHAEGEYQGKIAFRLSFGVIMPNITLEQAKETGLYKSLPYPKTVYQEEFQTWNEIESGELIARLTKMIDKPFTFEPLTNNLINTIKGAIHPEFIVGEKLASPNRLPKDHSYLPDSSILVTFNSIQENLARSVGHRIIDGVTGSGKTLIILAKAKWLAGLNPESQILILCYNVTFAAHLKALLGEKYENIKVLNFQAFVKSFVSRLPKEDSIENYDQHIGQLLLEKLATVPVKKKYDAILVDEAPNFPANCFQCCLAALKDPEHGHLMIAGDGNQKIYLGETFTWQSVGIEAKNYCLETNYRNTQEILSTSWDIITKLREVPNNENKDDQELLAFPLLETKNILRHGPSPSLHLGKYQVRHVLAKVKQLISQGYKPEEIAILYRDSDTDDKKSLKTICQLLDESGASSYWITKDNKSNLVYEANTPGVRILTILAAQGLEFKAVILMWTEKFDQDIFADDVATRNAACGELYGGLTRAQEILHLYASPTSHLVQELKAIASLTVVNL